MGSDSSPEVLFEAAVHCAGELPIGDSLDVFCTPEAANSFFVPDHLSNIEIHLSQEVILPEDDPLSAIRLKKDSSIVSGISFLKEKKIDAFVSAGNTGALIACSSLFLRHMPGIERSCLLALIPTQRDPMAMVDVGGWLTWDSNLLLKYAKLGAAYQRALFQKEKPTVALLNVGVESKKGTREVRDAFALLSQENEKWRFIGNVEGREVFKGHVDVLVTDGFTGNIMLKTSEGVSSFIFDYVRQALQEDSSLLENMKKKFSYDEYPGAMVCGVEGIVIKCHGAATKNGMVQSILGAVKLVESGVLNKMRLELS